MKKFSLIVILSVIILTGVTAQQNGQITGTATVVYPAKSETVAEIMERGKNAPVKMIDRGEREYPDRSTLPGNPFAKPLSIFPEPVPGSTPISPVTNSPQTLGTSFNGVTGPTETGAFPPDDMGAVGPTQYIVFVNGRIRSFTKSGVADGVLNVGSDVFFASVVSPPGAGQVSFTSDPRIRYERLSGKWIMVIIDVTLTSATGAIAKANRILIAFSNTSTITGATVWTFSQFTGEANKFADYETLGIDVNALYIGTNMFTLPGSFTGTNGYVINRTTLLSGGAYTVTTFLGLVATATGAGPFTPQGVDNYNTAATEGYFIGVDNATFNTLMLRRVTNPAGPTPTISANISIATPLTTRSPVLVPHLGNTGGTGGRLDALDDRLFAAVMRNGRIWTAHNIGVNNTGVAGATNNRNAARWYEIQNIASPGTPSILQSGTVYDNNATNDANQRNYWVPTIMVSGQGHAAIGMTSAGTNVRINAATVGRLSGDVLGTMQTPAFTTASSTAYNPPGDPGGPSRRWGDYSYVSLDPLDDMTMWMINQYCVGTNTYGCNVTKLLAPLPATPTSTCPAIIPAGSASVNVVVTGTSSAGSGYYDPGPNLPAPALAFSHISATVSGGITVNSVTYTDPTHVTLNLNTTAATQGPKTITITNPDGQSAASAAGVVAVNGVLPVTFKELRGKLNNNLTVSLNWTTSTENNNKGFFVERNESNSPAGWTSIGFVNGAGNSVVERNYSLVDNNIQLSKIYHYRLRQVDFDANYSYSNEVLIRVNYMQKNTLLLVNYPNPFTSVATLKYNLPAAGLVSLKIFDATGKEIAKVAEGYHQPGLYSIDFNADKLSKGTYICKLVFEGETVTNQMVLVK